MSGKNLTIDIGELRVSEDQDAVMVTHALGSCIGVMIWDPKRVAGGMIHYMLPESKVNPGKASARPGMFADTGIPMLFQSMYALGCTKGDLVVKVAGGSSLHDDKGVFDIGRRNYNILRKLFWKNGILIESEDVGGDKSRTVYFEIGTGRVRVRSGEGETEL